MSASGEGRVYPVILAGGFGTRLWPLSREAKPKHLLNLVGDLSLLQQTVQRAREGAETGVRYLAVGALTHSAPVLDIGADLTWEEHHASGD